MEAFEYLSNCSTLKNTNLGLDNDLKVFWSPFESHHRSPIRSPLKQILFKQNTKMSNTRQIHSASNILVPACRHASFQLKFFTLHKVIHISSSTRGILVSKCRESGFLAKRLLKEIVRPTMYFSVTGTISPQSELRSMPSQLLRHSSLSTRCLWLSSV
jgi:hypothetical protein